MASVPSETGLAKLPGAAGSVARPPRVREADGDIPLDALGRGEPAVVVRVDAPEAVRRRLLDLGLLPGTEIHLERRAPLGDPAVYALRGTRLCLRRSEARTVRVRPGG